mgnify:CR=1 FL=1
MDSPNKTKRLYISTIIIFIAIVVIGQLFYLWRGDDYKFLLLLFIIVSIALRLDDIYNALIAGKSKSSDMYLLDTRLQAIIESLDNLNHNMEKIALSQNNGRPKNQEDPPPQNPDLY